MRKVPILVFLTTFILLFSSVSMVNGAFTWSTPVKVSTDPVTVQTINRSPSLAVDSNGVVHIAWGSTDSKEYTSEIWYANNATGTFTPTQITSNSISDGNPSLALDSQGNVHIVWEGNYTAGNERDIYYINNVGGTFGSIITLLDDDYDEQYPQIAIDSNNKVHLVWQYDHGTTDTRYATNATAAFDSFMIMNVTDNDVADDYPTIAIDSNDVIHIAWSERVGFFYEVLYGNSSNPFPITNPVNVSQNSYDDTYPSIDVDSKDKVHIAWKFDDFMADSEIVYSNNIGGTFSSYEFVTINSIGDHSPSLVIDNNGDAHILWNGALHWEIWYANNTDGVFATPQNVSRSSNSDKYPDLFIDSEGFLHAVWYTVGYGVYYCSTLDKVVISPPVSEFGIAAVLMIALISSLSLLIVYRKKRKL
ncbi:MAG: hypothetical protein ACFE68_00895 [Candidatus Hodarchaeota archaeon]